jgi:hypothetical protein
LIYTPKTETSISFFFHLIEGRAMIDLEFIKSLSFSASSGLIKIENKFYSISDDQLALETFTLSSAEPHSFYPLFPGTLPSDSKERKSLKPDLEALIFLKEDLHPPFGAILAIPSGSTALRCHGALVPLQEMHELSSHPIAIDFSPLFRHLNSLFQELNIEGILKAVSEIKLFQRGNGSLAQNGIIDLNLDIFLKELIESHTVSADCFQSSSLIELPKLNGVQVSFTDAANFQFSEKSQLWFLAVAENTKSTFEDGPFSGSILGCLNSQHELIYQSELNCQEKPEGLWLDSNDSFYVVTDSDNAQKPSQMFRGQLPRLSK